MFDGPIDTLRYGFFELWIPRNRSIDLKIKRNALTATGVIQTYGESMTCITTFQLQ